MKLGIPREVTSEERRVAVVPRSVERLRKLGFEVVVEAGAGVKAECSDAKYIEAGASVVPSAADVYSQSDVVLKVNPPTEPEAAMLRKGQIVIGLIWPANQDAV
ncbi:MAG: hypothetical protein QF733_10475, partial [Phycisphaerales bacterium]|nr:hypothetical protein [Phycisphaerales bacterium]